MNQNIPKIPSHTSQNGQDQKLRWQKILARMWRKRNTPFHCWWDCKLVQSLCNSVWWFLRKVLPEDPYIPLLGIYPENAPTCNKDTCSTMFIAAIFIIARIWKEPRCPSTEDGYRKCKYICMMERSYDIFFNFFFWDLKFLPYMFFSHLCKVTPWYSILFLTVRKGIYEL